jgi:thiamine biosynthesis lipoprotein
MFTKHFECMGTVFTFKIADDLEKKRVEEDCQKAFDILNEADSQFSLYKPDSEISRLNRAEITWDEASSVQRDVRSMCEHWKSETSGFFDAVSSSGTYDPSGLVKTWATRNAALFLEANGYSDFTINAGGDIYLGPKVVTAPLTRVGLSNYVSISSPVASTNFVLELEGSGFFGVATSGSSERGEHIWPTGSSKPENQFLQVSVAGTDLVTADIWATAIVAGGTDALHEFEKKVPSELGVALVTDQEGRISSTAGFAKLLGKLS